MGKVRLFGLAVALLAGVAVTGCATSGACPAVAWNNTVEVHLTGNAGDVETIVGNAGEVAIVKVCADGDCAAGRPLQPVEQASMMPLELSTSGPQELQNSSPPPTDVPLAFPISRMSEGTWQLSVGFATPETLTVRAMSSAGEVLAEKEVVLKWRRVGGSEECGGPGVTEVVRLDIPS